CQRYSYSTWTF
nr:immunoglobulin light chain junction region [Macaca mulatta]MOV77921.1 immunoglobulin light chain junction region [Macaca mulatta]MOV79295.1 immunoglobulin light chain junction region [Macaca mulatta]MOV79615.1 immunoglobulin light chain junction region [Macaca mulatta]MOV79704.1 immunoglobulin light chain junction region [Macaca mulatta]